MDKEEFIALKDKWYEETCYISSPQVINDHECARKIAKEGEEVLPFIFDDIRKGTSTHWFFILREITGCSPIPKHHAGYISQLNKDWIEWYDRIYKKQVL